MKGRGVRTQRWGEGTRSVDAAAGGGGERSDGVTGGLGRNTMTKWWGRIEGWSGTGTAACRVWRKDE